MSGPASAFGLLGGSVGGFPGGFMGLPPGMQSPLPIMALGHPGQATPVSEHLVSMSWLRNLTTALPALVSAVRIRHLVSVHLQVRVRTCI